MRIGFRSKAKGAFLYNRRLKIDRDIDVVENRYRLVERLRDELAPPAALPRIARTPVEFSEEEEREFGAKFGDIVTGDFVAIHPFSKLAYRSWPEDRFVRLASELTEREPDGRIVVTTGGRPFETRGAAGRIAVLDNTSVRELAWVLSKARIFIGNNSGPLHLAVAMGTAAIAIAGPTARRWRPHEFGDALVINIDAGLDCSHCEKAGVIRCPRGLKVPECMEKIGVDRVLDAVSNISERALS